MNKEIQKDKPISKEELKLIYNKYANQNGYMETPPDIMTFISDDYYLGKSFNGGKALYPYWKKRLIELYPTPFPEHNRKKLGILMSAISTGKCFFKEQDINIFMSEEDIKKYNLEEYVVKE